MHQAIPIRTELVGSVCPSLVTALAFGVGRKHSLALLNNPVNEPIHGLICRLGYTLVKFLVPVEPCDAITSRPSSVAIESSSCTRAS